MSAVPPALVKTWTVGSRYRVTLTVPPLGTGVAYASCEWEPHMPAFLTPQEKADYRRGLSAAISKLGLVALAEETQG